MFCSSSKPKIFNILTIFNGAERYGKSSLCQELGNHIKGFLLREILWVYHFSSLLDKENKMEVLQIFRIQML